MSPGQRRERRCRCGRCAGQAATEFALLCLLVAAALLWPFAGAEPLALRWLAAWGRFMDFAGRWLADA